MSDKTDNKSKKIILASASLRRCELLKLITEDFDVISADVDETLENGISPEEAVIYLSRKKAAAVSEKNCGRIVIGADTVVVCGEKILGKPQDDDDAFSMLAMLSGRTHRVLTGVTLTDGKRTESFYAESEVTFWSLSEEEIRSYIKSGEVCDKAGAYAIQGRGALLVEKITGDYFNIVGLPVSALNRKIKEFKAADM